MSPCFFRKPCVDDIVYACVSLNKIHQRHNTHQRVDAPNTNKLSVENGAKTTNVTS